MRLTDPSGFSLNLKYALTLTFIESMLLSLSFTLCKYSHASCYHTPTFGLNSIMATTVSSFKLQIVIIYCAEFLVRNLARHHHDGVKGIAGQCYLPNMKPYCTPAVPNALKIFVCFNCYPCPRQEVLDTGWYQSNITEERRKQIYFVSFLSFFLLLFQFGTNVLQSASWSYTNSSIDK